MRNKRIILTACLLVSVSIVILLWFKYATQIKKFFGFKEFVITTTYGDRFLVKSKNNMASLTDQTETYKLYYLSPGQNKKTFLVEFVLKEFKNFAHQYKDDHIRAYITFFHIIYAENHENVFKAILLDKADLKRQRDLIPVVKYFLYDPYYLAP